MAARGRPAKVLTPTDLDELKLFLQQLPFLKKNQEQALALLESSDTFDERQMGLLKTVDREKNRYQQRQTLIEQIRIKQTNRQKLLANESEILGLLEQEQDRDTFFRLDRALESYMKIEKAAREDRIRLENEQRRELLQKTGKQLTEAQKKRNAKDQIKYALGGAVLAAWKRLQLPAESIDPKKVEEMMVISMRLTGRIQQTALYKEANALTNDPSQTRELLVQVMDAMMKYAMKDEPLYRIELKNLHKPE